MIETDYSLNKVGGECVQVLKDNEINAISVAGEEGALHAIFVLEGKEEGHFYSHENNKVFLTMTKGKNNEN